MANILIIGGSKGIGLETVKQALASGHSVRAFARSADRIGVVHQSLEKRKGSALKAADVASALDGIDVVIMAIGISAGPRMLVGPINLFSESTRVVIKAMEEAGVRRLICVTGYGAGDSRTSLGCLQGLAFSLVMGRAYDDKSDQEELIRQSALDWVIARPVILTRGRRTGHYRVLADADQWRNGLISRSDVADFLVGQIDDDAYLGKTPVLSY